MANMYRTHGSIFGKLTSLFFPQPASKDQVVGMLDKARAVMPDKPAAPAKAAASKSASSAPAAKTASGDPNQMFRASLKSGYFKSMKFNDSINGNSHTRPSTKHVYIK